MKLLSITLPNGEPINAPAGVPEGGLTYLGGVLRNGLTIMIILAVFFALIFIVWSGLQWISSGGDKNKLAQARGRLTWAIVGLIITFATFFFLSAIGYLFRVDLLKFGG